MAENNASAAISQHLNLNVRGLSLSATLAINERSAQLRKEGKKIYKFGLGQSPFPVPPSVEEALKSNAHQKDYLPVKGLPELCDAVAGYHNRTQFLDYSGEDIMIAPGSKELMFLLQLVYYGDLVVPTPSWVSYAPQAHIVGRHVRWLKTKAENGWRLEPDELEKLCKVDPDRPRILILNYPSNPTGYTLSPGQLEAIADVARKYNCVILSDEIYGELHHDTGHVSIARDYPEGTIISSGLSKWCGAGGWRLGTFAFPPSLKKLQQAMSVAASETFTSTCAPIQYAAVRAFNGGIDIEEYLWHSRLVLKALSAKIVRMMDEAGIEIGEAEGGFYLFPDFSKWRETLAGRGIETSEKLCERILEETGVALLPGSFFGRPEDELTARMAYVDFDGSRALAACKGLSPGQTPDDRFLEKHCAHLLEGVEKLCDWTTG